MLLVAAGIAVHVEGPPPATSAAQPPASIDHPTQASLPIVYIELDCPVASAMARGSMLSSTVSRSILMTSPLAPHTKPYPTAMSHGYASVTTCPWNESELPRR